MAARGEQEFFNGTAQSGGDGIDLSDGAVFVLFALDEEDGTVDAGHVHLDVPAAERGREPHVGPAVE
jgi:hypothetical protein